MLSEVGWKKRYFTCHTTITRQGGKKGSQGWTSERQTWGMLERKNVNVNKHDWWSKADTRRATHCWATSTKKKRRSTRLEQLHHIFSDLFPQKLERESTKKTWNMREGCFFVLHVIHIYFNLFHLKIACRNPSFACWKASPIVISSSTALSSRMTRWTTAEASVSNRKLQIHKRWERDKERLRKVRREQ